MATKRPKSAPTDLRTDVVRAALKLAAKRDWGNITLANIARAAGCTLAELSAVFESRDDIVAAYGRMVDRDVLADYADGVPGNTDKDKLFEIFMARFDRLQNDRDALVSIIQSCQRDPKQLVIGLPGVARSMTWTLEACGIETQGWRGAGRVLGLSAIYLWILRTWVSDSSEDLSKTMAALDRALDRGGQWSETLGF